MSDERRRAVNVGFDAGWDAHAAYSKPDVREAVQAAYEAGWRDACDDHRQQAGDAAHPIGNRYRPNYAEEVDRG